MSEPMDTDTDMNMATDTDTNTNTIDYDAPDISRETLDQLINLGFEEDELEAFVSNPEYFSDFPANLIQKYLEIAHGSPDSTAKRIIAETALDAFYHPSEENEMDMDGGKRRRTRKRRTKRSRKSRRRKTKKRKSRRRTRRSRR
jgi:hypothetical protein